MLKLYADALHSLQIAATDKGPKVFSLGTASSNGYNSFDVSWRVLSSALHSTDPS